MKQSRSLSVRPGSSRFKVLEPCGTFDWLDKTTGTIGANTRIRKT